MRRSIVAMLALTSAVAFVACTPRGRDTRKVKVPANQTADARSAEAEDDPESPIEVFPVGGGDSGTNIEPDSGIVEPPPSGLVYTAPPAGAAVRLLAHPSSTSTTVVLELVASRALSGYFMGMSLAIDQSRVEYDAASSFEVGAALNPGLAPAAVRASIASAGPRAGQLSIGISQKSSGAGAVPDDATIAPGAVFFRLILTAQPMAAPGIVFDGAGVDAGLRDKNGTDVLRAEDFAIGTLRFY